MRALSIRQPWAWLIVNGHKDVENRQWRTNFRGRFLVHAAKGMTRDEYAVAFNVAKENGVTLPDYEDLERGGFIGEVDIVDCVTDDPSPWFYGEFGFVLKNPKPVPFRPYKGALQFFNVKEEVP